jgi:hypothetical protein
LLLICNTSQAFSWANATREYKAGEQHRIEEAGKLICHELTVESVTGYTREHILRQLQFYKDRLSKHPRDVDLKTKIKVLEFALNSPECGIAIQEELEYIGSPM